MDTTIQSSQIGHMKGKLLRLEKNLNQINRNIGNAARKRLVGGVILLVSLLILVVSFVTSSQFFTFAAVLGLFIGGMVFVKALVRMSGARQAMDSVTDRVTGMKSVLAELIVQVSGTD